MRTTVTALVASALALAATPAMAQSISDADANAMLAKISTSAFEFCTDSDNAKSRPAIDQYNACQTALAELGQMRAKNARATPGEKEVYKFYESAIEMGNTYAMLRVDEKPTARVCANIEHQWVLSNAANPNVVGKELQDAQSSTKEAVRPLVKLCREQFSTPAGALPI